MFEEKLIKAVKEHRCLYDKSLASYRDKSDKEKAWKDVAVAVNANEGLCHTKWRNLRDRFLKELKKKQTNAGSEEPDWKHLKALMFIKGHIAPRTSIGLVTKLEPEDKLCENLQNATDVPASEGENGIPGSEGENGIPASKGENGIPASKRATDVPPIEVLKETTLAEGTRNQSQLSCDTPSTSAPPPKRMKVQQTSETQTSQHFELLVSALQNILAVRSLEQRSRNTNFLHVLDEYLLKLPERRQDALKIDMLNLVYNEVSDITYVDLKNEN